MKRVADSSQDAASGCEEGVTDPTDRHLRSKHLQFSNRRHLNYCLFVRRSVVVSMIRKPLGRPAKGAPVLEQPWLEGPVRKEVEETIVFCVAA